MATEFIQRFQPAVEHTVSHRFRSTEDFEMNMGYINYVMEEQGKIMRLFPSDKDSNGEEDDPDVKSSRAYTTSRGAR